MIVLNYLDLKRSEFKKSTEIKTERGEEKDRERVKCSHRNSGQHVAQNISSVPG